MEQEPLCNVGFAITKHGIVDLIDTTELSNLLATADFKFESKDGNFFYLWQDNGWSPEDSALLVNNLSYVCTCDYIFVRVWENGRDQKVMGSWFGNEFKLGLRFEMMFDHSNCKIIETENKK